MGAKNNNYIHLLVFRLDGRHYALALEYVERVLRVVVVNPVPEAPSWISGVVNLGGRVIPVMDLRRRLGNPPKPVELSDRLIIAQIMERKIALLVDEVTEVLETSAGHLEEVLDPLLDSGLLAAVIRKADELILVLDAVQLVNKEEGLSFQVKDDNREAGEHLR